MPFNEMSDLTPRLRTLSKQVVILYIYDRAMKHAVGRLAEKVLWVA